MMAFGVKGVLLANTCKFPLKYVMMTESKKLRDTLLKSRFVSCSMVCLHLC
jgi:hypothetical protein